MKYSCCIEMIYTEYDFIERIYKAAKAGFEYFEFWNWQDKDIPAIKKAMQDTGIKLAAFQGSLNGVMVDKNDFELYLKEVEDSLKVARELGAENVFCISDILLSDRSVKPHKYYISPEEQRASSVKVLKAVAVLADKYDVNIVIEPLNTKVDHANYSLSHTADGVSIIEEVGSPRVRLLYDAYHMQIMEGNIIDTIKQYVKYFGHFHVADVPGRNQIGTGELNYLNIFRALKAEGYDRTVGFELSPKAKSSDEVVKETFELIARV